MSSQQPLTQGGHLAFGDSDDDDALFNEEMCALLGSTVATLRSGGTGTDAHPALGQASHEQRLPQYAPPSAPQIFPRAPAPPPSGLKWNAAGGLARAAQQGRQQMLQTTHQTQHVEGSRNEGPQAFPGHHGQRPGHHLPGVQAQLQQEQFRPPGVQSTPATSFQSYHQSNSYQPQQSAQISELQRQVEQYKQQLMFAQQELNEVRRSRHGTSTRDVAQQHDQQGILAHRRVDQTKGVAGEGRPHANLNMESPSANNNKAQREGQRALSTPPSVSLSTQNTTKETVASIVPRFIGQMAMGIGGSVVGNMVDGHHADHQSVPLMYRLERLDREIAYLKEYRIKRAEIFSILDEQHDVPGSVLVNLEAMLSFGAGVHGGIGSVSDADAPGRKPNVKDIGTMLLSVLTHVLGADADMVLGKIGEPAGKGGAHHVLSEYNTNATNNTATMTGVFPTEVMCTTAGTAAATTARPGEEVGGAGGVRVDHGDARRSTIARNRCLRAFTKFVGSFFTILNEFARDPTLLASMIDELAEDDVYFDGGARRDTVDVASMPRKIMVGNIVRTLEVLSRVDALSTLSARAQPRASPLASGSLPSSFTTASSYLDFGSFAMESLAKFLHELARLRSDRDKSILTPILKSKQLESALLAYPGAPRDYLIKFVMIMLEDKHMFACMELEAAKELEVTPSKHAVDVLQSSTPSKARAGINSIARPRRHSVLNKRLGIENGDKPEDDTFPGDPYWASRLTQTINLCMSTDTNQSIPETGASLGSSTSSKPCSWVTVRLCLAFFASLVERSADALLQSVVDFKYLEKFSDDGREVETLMHHIVRIAGVASGDGNLLHPKMCSETDVDQQRAYLRQRRIVHESLVLLRALLTKVPGAVRCLAMEDSNAVLCVLEKIAIGYPLSTINEPTMADGRLALWVDTLDTAYGRTTPSSLKSIAKAVKAMLLRELAPN